MGCLEHDLSLFNIPTEAKYWTLAAKKSVDWPRRFEEAAEQYVKRYFVTDKEQVALSPFKAPTVVPAFVYVCPGSKTTTTKNVTRTLNRMHFFVWPSRHHPSIPQVSTE